jgi:hypothetical protein
MRLEIVVTLSAVTACAPVPNRAQHSVNFYRAHPAALTEQLARCANDPGRLGRMPECVNARAAARSVGVGSLGRLAPMGLPVKPSSGSEP